MLVAACTGGQIGAAPVPPPAPDLPTTHPLQDEGRELIADRGPATKAPSKPTRVCPLAAATLVDRPDFTRVRSRIERVRQWDGVVSVAVAAGRQGRVIWAEGFGWADKRRRIKATPDTMYSIASVSKPFTATAIMVLREQGKLKLGEPANTYLGEVGITAGVGDAQNATIERLANHTAGMPLHYRFFFDDAPPPPEVTRQRHAVLVTKPGERYRYSNLGYGILEHVIERISGLDYPRFMQHHVFDPLGLKHTSVGKPGKRDRRRVAVRYDGSGDAIPDYGFDHDGASAIYASARDLVVFGMAQTGFVGEGLEPLLPPESFARMRKVQAPSENYALGWGVREANGEPVIAHSGGMPGVRTYLVVYTKRDLAIAVVLNTNSGRTPIEIANLVARAVGVPQRNASICALPPDHAALGKFQGSVEIAGKPRAFELLVEHDGRVRARFDDAPAIDLTGVRVKDASLEGNAFAHLGAEAARGEPTRVAFDLQIRGDELTGSITTMVPHIAATTHFVRASRAGS